MFFNQKKFNTTTVIFILFIVLTSLSRIMLSSWDRNCFGFDDANFALSAQSYSIIDSRPHLPGYFLHVKLIRLLVYVTGNVFSAMSLLSALYSGFASGFLFLLCRKWFINRDAVLIVLFTITNPVIWFYGCSTEVYSFDLFFGTLAVYFGVSSRLIYFLPVIMALGTGVRQSSGVLLFPLYCYLWIHCHASGGIDWKKFIIAHCAATAALILWLFPMIHSSGGLSAYLGLYKTNNPMDQGDISFNVYRFISYTVSITVPVAIVCILRLIVKDNSDTQASAGLTRTGKQYAFLCRLLFFWIVPPVLFFLGYAYSKGYILLVAGGISCALFCMFYRYHLRHFLFGLLILLQSLYFIATPYTIPDIEVFISPQERTSGFARIWMARMRSSFLSAHSCFRRLQGVDVLFSAVVDSIQGGVEDPFFAKEFILIDPTCPIIVRSLQAKYPHIHFAAMDVHHEDGFFTYKGLDYANRKGIRSLLASSLIFGRTDYIRRYNLESLVDRKDFGEWSLYRYKEGAFSQGDLPHEVHFLRYK